MCPIYSEYWLFLGCFEQPVLDRILSQSIILFFFSIVGCHVTIPSEVILLNSVVLPNKQLRHSIKNEIVL